LPNPYGISPRLTGFVNAIYVQASNAAAVPNAIDEVTEILDARHQIRSSTGADFNVRNLSQIASAAEGSAKIGVARGSCVDFVARRRHWDHEHPARVGHGADTRNRSANGDRRAAPARAAAVS